MNWNAPNAMVARLELPSGPPNAVIAEGRNRGKTPNAIIAKEKRPNLLIYGDALRLSEYCWLSRLVSGMALNQGPSVFPIALPTVPGDALNRFAAISNRTIRIARPKIVRIAVKALLYFHTFLTWPSLQNLFGDFFFELAWEFCIENAGDIWWIFLVSVSHKTKHKKPSRNRGRFGAKFGANESLKNSGDFRSATFLTQHI